uniref:Uncharacterized protein n=1 Tax=viral metagenome TaxID=1070528 RepID=A0A6C0I0F8_9ZZZZ
MIMLKSLFPTKYPYQNNIKTSFDVKINKFPQLNLDFSQDFLRFFRFHDDDKEDAKMYPEYSYLNLEGKTNTVTEVIWINDIYNHPKYKQLFKKYNDLIFYKKTYSKILKDIIDSKKDIFKEIEIDSKIDSEIDSEKAVEKAIKILEDIKKEIDAKIKLEAKDRYSNSIRQYNDDKDLISKIIENIGYTKENINKIEFDPSKIEKNTSISLNEFDNKIKSFINQINKYENKIDETLYFKNDQILLDLFEKIKYIKKTIDNIKDNVYLYYEYFNKKDIKKKIIYDNKITDTKKIEKFKDFFDEINKFLYNVYPSNNGYLQKKINEYINNENDSLLDIIKINDISKHIKEIYTGVNINISENSNEIFLHIDVIEGEINDDNKQNIKCIYPGEKLTDKLDTLLSTNEKKYELNPRRMLFVLDEMKSYSKKGFGNNVKAINPVENNGEPQITGGKSKIEGKSRKYICKKNTTRRLKSYYIMN